MRSSDHLAPLLTSIPQNSWKSISPDPSPSARSNALLFAIILSSSLRNAFRSKSLARADRAESRASLRPCPVLLSFPGAAPLSAPIIDNTRLRTRFAIPLALPAGVVWRSTNLSQMSTHVRNVRRWRIHGQRAESKHVHAYMDSLAGLGVCSKTRRERTWCRWRLACPESRRPEGLHTRGVPPSALVSRARHSRPTNAYTRTYTCACTYTCRKYSSSTSVSAP